MFYYQLYGLKVQSNTEFPQLLAREVEDPEKDIANITIEVTDGSSLRNRFASYLEKNEICTFTENGLWFHNQAGDFLIETSNGKTKMLCEKNEDTGIGIARSFLMGNCIAFAMTQRKTIVLHGSTLVLGDKTILVCGDSGTGKSTTAMALIDKGAKLMADDISVIDVDMTDGKAYAYSSFPEQKLCRDAAEKGGYDLESLTYVNEDRDKFSLDKRDVFIKGKRKVDYLISLHTAPKEAEANGFADGLLVKEIQGAEKVNAITDRFFLGWFYGTGLSLAPAEMMKCITLAGQIKILDITRLRGVDTREAMTRAICSRVAAE